MLGRCALRLVAVGRSASATASATATATATATAAGPVVDGRHLRRIIAASVPSIPVWSAVGGEVAGRSVFLIPGQAGLGASRHAQGADAGDLRAHLLREGHDTVPHSGHDALLLAPVREVGVPKALHARLALAHVVPPGSPAVVAAHVTGVSCSNSLPHRSNHAGNTRADRRAAGEREAPRLLRHCAPEALDSAVRQWRCGGHLFLVEDGFQGLLCRLPHPLVDRVSSIRIRLPAEVESVLDVRVVPLQPLTKVRAREAANLLDHHKGLVLGIVVPLAQPREHVFRHLVGHIRPALRHPRDLSVQVSGRGVVIGRERSIQLAPIHAAPDEGSVQTCFLLSIFP
mmetsp:Transcript_3740/g.14660  ORF Transcript_3740/g.14660 Transcript_3740/m.14660 type:complete len:343 (+) Transcript_3740:1877-2905(+)